MFRTNLYEANGIHRIVDRAGHFAVLEYERDISVKPAYAMEAYFASEMNIRKKQVVVSMDGSGGVIVQAGAMQMMVGDIKVAADVKGAGDLLKKVVGSKVTGETAIKPRYKGNGILVLEPTYRFIILQDLAEWNGNMVIEDGMFLACDDTIDLTVAGRRTISSAVLGGEGLFNTALRGNGIAVLESPVPADELIVVDLQDDVLKIDGNMAIAWSDTLKFSVEKTTATFIGSAASGEGLVNVYRGSGRVLVAPVAVNRDIAVPKPVK